MNLYFLCECVCVQTREANKIININVISIMKIEKKKKESEGAANSIFI